MTAYYMRYGSVCSGIEAATAAWHPLGWEPAFFSEIEKFPRAVLGHHYPDTPLHGDFTTIGADEYGAIDLLVGGTPCQSFSVAGLRKGMADERGNLALEYLKLAERTGAKWLVWENVPGVLSSNGGRDFGSFLGGLGELGYGFAYRVLDAQYFGVPQRRRRVFVVGYLGDWRPPAAVLFERQSLQGHSAPSREARETAPTIPATSTGGGGPGTDSDLDGGLQVTQWKNHLTSEVVGCVNSAGGNAVPGNSLQDAMSHQPIPVHIMSSGQSNAEISEELSPALNCNRDGAPIAFGGQNCVAFAENARGELRLEGGDGQRVGALSTGGGKPGQGAPTVASFTVSNNSGGFAWESDVSPTLQATPPSDSMAQQYGVRTGMSVRRLTPIECERLQGFPDDYTRIPWRNKPPEGCPDGPRYKALGNSMAVPVMRWIGERIQQVKEGDSGMSFSGKGQ